MIALTRPYAAKIIVIDFRSEVLKTNARLTAAKRRKPDNRTFFLPILSESFPKKIMKAAEIILKRR